MKIPVRDPNQVDLAPLSGYQAQSTYVRPASIAGAVAGGLERIVQAQEQADNLRAEEALNEARLRQIELRTEASQKRGAAVLPMEGKGFVDSYLEKFDEGMSKVEANLGNSRQKFLFKQRANLLKQNLQADLGAHEAQEMKAHADEVDANTVALEVDNAKANVGNLRELALGQIRVDGAVDSLAQRNGWSPEKTQVERQKAMTQFHGGVIGTALDSNNLKYAKTYLEQHGDELSADFRAKAQEAIQKKEASLTVDAKADAIWSVMGPKGDSDAVNLDKLLAEARKEEDPEMRKNLEAEIKDRAHVHDYSVKQRTDAAVSTFFQSIEKGKSWKDIKNDPAFMALDGKTQNGLRKHYEDERGITQGGGGVPSNAGKEYWKLVELPDKLKSMSVDEIWAMTPMLGPKYRDDLLDRREKLMRPPKEGKVTEGVVNDAIKHFGIKGGYLRPDGTTPVNVDEWAELNYKINQRIASEGANTEAEVSNVVRSTLAKAKVETSGRLWGKRTEDKPLAKMTDKELNEAVVKVAPGDLETIYAAFLRRGIVNPTKRQILEAHAALMEEE